VRAIVRRAAKDDYRLSAIVAGIVTSDAFRMQAKGMSAAVGAVYDRPRSQIAK